MTSLESTGAVRPARPDAASPSSPRQAALRDAGSDPRLADAPPADRDRCGGSAASDDSPLEVDLASRGSPDPLVATDRYRLTQPYTLRV